MLVIIIFTIGISVDLKHTQKGSELSLICGVVGLLGCLAAIAMDLIGIVVVKKHEPISWSRNGRWTRLLRFHADGMGVGLAIAHCLVELQGGTPKVESELSKGSTFFFSLPIA